MKLKLDLSRIPNDAKFRELVVFIARESEGDKQFGAIKLNKLLFYCDFLAYLNHGRAITNQVYQRLKQGPAPRRLLPILKEMEEKGDVVRGERKYFGKTQKVVIACREPKLSVFTRREVDLIHGVIKDYWNKNAAEISEQSHRFRGWKLAKDKEMIPYEVALVEFRRPTRADHDRFRELGAELKKVAKDRLASDDA